MCGAHDPNRSEQIAQLKTSPLPLTQKSHFFSMSSQTGTTTLKIATGADITLRRYYNTHEMVNDLHTLSLTLSL